MGARLDDYRASPGTYPDGSEFLDAGPDVAGEVAAARAGGPGSFRVQLRDALDKAARTAK